MNADQTPNDEKAVTADSTETVAAGSDSSPAHGSESAVVVRDIVIRNLNGVLAVALKKLGASQDTIDALEDGDFEHVLWWLEAQTQNEKALPLAGGESGSGNE